MEWKKINIDYYYRNTLDTHVYTNWMVKIEKNNITNYQFGRKRKQQKTEKKKLGRNWNCYNFVCFGGKQIFDIYSILTLFHQHFYGIYAHMSVYWMFIQLTKKWWWLYYSSFPMVYSFYSSILNLSFIVSFRFTKIAPRIVDREWEITVFLRCYSTELLKDVRMLPIAI